MLDPANLQQQFPQFNLPAVSSHEIRVEQAPFPSAQVPKFSGKQEDWESFRHLFESVVISRNVSRVIMLQKLLEAVQGPAARSIKHLELIESNFEVAWNWLIHRYDNPRPRLLKFLDAFIDLNQVRKGNIDVLNDLLDSAAAARHGLIDVHCNVEQQEEWIVYCIVRKLDLDLRESWKVSEKNVAPEDKPTYDKLVKFLEKRIQSLEQACASEISGDYIGNKGSRQESSRRSNSCNVNVTSTSSLPKNKKEPCLLCNSPHYLFKCKKFSAMPQDKRFEFVKLKKFCMNCLRTYHFVNDCKVNIACFFCHRRHNSKLHFTSKKVNSQSESSS